MTNEGPELKSLRIFWGAYPAGQEPHARERSARITLKKTMEIAVADKHMIKPRVKCGMRHTTLPYQPKGAYGVEAFEPEQVNKNEPPNVGVFVQHEQKASCTTCRKWQSALV